MGATGPPTPPCRYWVGLSPRVRGNRCAYFLTDAIRRSIPASAGQPLRWGVGSAVPRVYPRECGATYCSKKDVSSGGGLSPRVRGNLRLLLVLLPLSWSIPASAGQPSRPGWPAAPTGVYPRECGATQQSPEHCQQAKGLSPRVRGNLSAESLQELEKGSIPASAGQPLYIRHLLSSREVYPRECGATSGHLVSIG